MAPNLIQKVLIKGFPSFRLTILCFFWSVMAAISAVLLGFLLMTYLRPMDGAPVVLQKKIPAFTFLGTDHGFSEEEIRSLRQWPEVKKLGSIQTARVPLYLQLDLKGSQWGSSLFLESVPDDWLDAGLSWPDLDANTVPLLLGKDFLDLYNWGFAPSQGLPKLSLAEASLIPLRLTAGGPGSQTFSAKIVGTSEKYQTFLIPDSWMARLSGKSKPAVSRLLCQVETGQFSRFQDRVNARGWEMTSTGGSNPWRSFSEYLLAVFLGVVMLFTLLMTGWAFLLVQLWWSRLRERVTSLLELCCDPAAMRRNLSYPFFRILLWTAIPEFLIILGLGFWLKSEMGPAMIFDGLAGGIFLLMTLGFAFLYSQSLKKNLNEILKNLS